MGWYSDFGQKLVPKKIKHRLEHRLLRVDLTAKHHKGALFRLLHAADKIAMPSPR